MWMLADGYHADRALTHEYEPTREAAMAAFAKSWRQRVMVLASPPADAKERPRR
jgi:hypothetical protein